MSSSRSWLPIFEVSPQNVFVKGHYKIFHNRLNRRIYLRGA